MVTLVTEAQYGRLCSALAREDLAADPRFGSFALRADCAEDLADELRKVFLSDTTASWLSRLHAADIIADRILNPSEWIDNEHVLRRVRCAQRRRGRKRFRGANARNDGQQ